MHKTSTFLNETEFGQTVFPLFGPNDGAFEKTAAPSLLPEVSRYISTLKPTAGSQYVLVNAMGAGEYWGSNVNADFFEESGLLHEPPGWAKNPATDRAKGKNWTYGYPTFYRAHPFLHHKNKDAARAYGVVDFAAWHPLMHRVELVCRVDYDKCLRFGGMSCWDRIKAGQFPDVSMGSHVCYDLSSLTTDWDEYNTALRTFDPKKHAYPGLAVVEYHKKLLSTRGHGIRGLNITRADYDELTRAALNRILPDGRKGWVYNPYPRFFDISFVFVGADRTAKTMVLIVREGSHLYRPPPGIAQMGQVRRALQLKNQPLEKAAAAVSAELARPLFKPAAAKAAEIEKEVVPAPEAAKAVPILQEKEEPLPSWALDALSACSPEKALGTTASMGIVLRPQEFQRIMLAQAGESALADKLDAQHELFPRSVECATPSMSFLPALASILLPLLAARSGLAPFVEARFSFGGAGAPQQKAAEASHPGELLRKIGAAYNGYRRALMSHAATVQDVLPAAAPGNSAVSKLASAAPSSLFNALSYRYLTEAYLDELPVRGSS